MNYMNYVKSGIPMSERNQDISIYGTVKVGDRGQVVIPAEARKDLPDWCSFNLLFQVLVRAPKVFERKKVGKAHAILLERNLKPSAAPPL
jgi:hypothetical protein